jgi:hypothetical protein
VAEVCDPSSVESIRQAVRRAYDLPPDPARLAGLLKRCTWDEAARETEEGYRKALALVR